MALPAKDRFYDEPSEKTVIVDTEGGIDPVSFVYKPSTFEKPVKFQVMGISKERDLMPPSLRVSIAATGVANQYICIDGDGEMYEAFIYSEIETLDGKPVTVTYLGKIKSLLGKKKKV